MYRWIVGVLVMGILGVGLLVMDSAVSLKSKVDTRNVEMEQMLTGIGK